MDCNDLIHAALEVDAVLSDLKNASLTLAKQLREHGSAVYAYSDPLSPSDESMAALIKAFTSFYYEEGQNPKETIRFPGAIGCNQDALDLAAHINKIKDSFAGAYGRLMEYNTAKAKKRFFLEFLPNVFAQNNKTLPRDFQSMVHLCLKQTTRHIPLSLNNPTLISWHWVNQPKSVTNISHKKARSQLQALAKDETTGDYIQRQIDICNGLRPSDELKVLQVSNRPALRVTYAWGPRVSDREHSLASMPLLYPWRNKNDRLPRFRFHSPEPKKNKPQKASYLLPSIRVALGK